MLLILSGGAVARTVAVVAVEVVVAVVVVVLERRLDEDLKTDRACTSVSAIVSAERL